jgi:ligand-binding SRPBCC domain-containing protein
MKILQQTQVNCGFEGVVANFDKKLFEYLLPPDFVAQLIRYDGSSPGSVVHIRFNFPRSSDWISEIISEKRETGFYEFVDIGKKLPFGLKSWEHHHIVKKLTDSKTLIADEMRFSTHIKLLDFIFFPFLFLAFYPRKKQYKRYFEQLINLQNNGHNELA